MKIANSLLFAAFVLGAGSLPAQNHQSVTSPDSFNLSGNTVLGRIDTAGRLRAHQILALLPDSAGYSHASADTGDDPPAGTMDPSNPCANGPVADDPRTVIDNYNALVGQGISQTDAKQIAQITRETGI